MLYIEGAQGGDKMPGALGATVVQGLAEAIGLIEDGVQRFFDCLARDRLLIDIADAEVDIGGVAEVLGELGHHPVDGRRGLRGRPIG